jgi:hypothetical protein
VAQDFNAWYTREMFTRLFRAYERARLHGAFLAELGKMLLESSVPPPCNLCGQSRAVQILAVRDGKIMRRSYCTDCHMRTAHPLTRNV